MSSTREFEAPAESDRERQRNGEADNTRRSGTEDGVSGLNAGGDHERRPSASGLDALLPYQSAAVNSPSPTSSSTPATLGAYTGPDLARTLADLERSAKHLARSLEASVQASAAAIEEISKYAVENFEQLADASVKYASDVEEATSFAHSYVLKCAQLDSELGRITRFEEQLAHVQSLLPTLTSLVNRKIQQHRMQQHMQPRPQPQQQPQPQPQQQPQQQQSQRQRSLNSPQAPPAGPSALGFEGTNAGGAYLP